ncbi:MAG: acyl--CoA ligase [Rhizobacter sp.]|nr:acyl--CoA ligase [Chlorobiales bacterium]
MDKQTIFNTHLAHSVKQGEETYLPTDYLIAEETILEVFMRQVAAHADETFLTFYAADGSCINYTYAETALRVFRTANFLLAQELIEEDRIATVSYNHIDTVVQYLAAWCVGMTVVPINASESPERIAYILQHSETKLCFVRDEYVEMISNLGVETLVVASNDFESLIAEHAGELTAGKVQDSRGSLADENYNASSYADLETEALIVYTSGTTGQPKGVVLTQYNLLVDADSISTWHGIAAGDAMMCVLPIHHVNGTVVTILTPLYAGGRVVLCQKFQTDVFFEWLASESISIVSVVPTLLAFLLQADIDISSLNLSYFKHFICGAGPLTVELCAKFEDRYGLKVIHGYGLSETTCYSCFLPVDLSAAEHQSWLRAFGFPSIGVAVAGNEMQIFNERGEPVREGYRGEIVIRGHNVMKGYYRDAEANQKAFERGWFHSGDEGFYKTDAEGRKFFFITGRLKELIIRGGVNLSPLEIDEVLMQIDGVKSAIAVGFENDWYGEEVGAYVQLQGGAALTAEVILLQCAQKLPPNKCPKVVVFGDAIPVTSTGKYQRNKVKHLFAAWKSVQFKK